MADESADPTADGGVETDTTDASGTTDATGATDTTGVTDDRPLGLPRWVTAMAPILLLVVVLGVFMLTTPLAGVQGGEPLPDVTVSHATMPTEETVVLHVTNNGPKAITISQVLVDEAYWNFAVEGSGGDRTLAPLESARIVIPYHWNPGWDVGITLVLDSGATFHHTIVAASGTPGFSLGLLWTMVLIGLFVGVIPVALGMLWFPYIQSMSDRALHAVLLFAAGVLGFLAVDTTVGALEVAEQVPGAYEGTALVALGVVGALFLVQSASAWRDQRVGEDVATDGGTATAEGSGATADAGVMSEGLWIAYLVALSIGLHNLAEGLAIGSSFALGRVSLGTFLVIGFMLHNVTEGPAVVAPVARGERPAAKHFVALGLIAGGPVVLGGWIGSLAYTPTLGAFFLALGVGAILQVNWEIVGMVRRADRTVATATNLLAALAGFVVMYVTDIFVAL